MKRHLSRLLVIATLAVPAAASHAGRISAEERAHIREASDPSLGSMRAGRDQDAKTMRDSERTTLRSAESKAPELGELRGGLDTVEVLLIVVLVLLILILI